MWLVAYAAWVRASTKMADLLSKPLFASARLTRTTSSAVCGILTGGFVWVTIGDDCVCVGTMIAVGVDDSTVGVTALHAEVARMRIASAKTNFVFDMFTCFYISQYRSTRLLMMAMLSSQNLRLVISMPKRWASSAAGASPVEASRFL